MPTGARPWVWPVAGSVGAIVVSPLLSIASGQDALDLIAEHLDRRWRIAVPQPRSLGAEDVAGGVAENDRINAAVRPLTHCGKDALDARRPGVAGIIRAFGHRSSWRERMGVEPTTRRRAPRHWF